MGTLKVLTGGVREGRQDSPYRRDYSGRAGMSLDGLDV
jgi:hypothetical protein